MISSAKNLTLEVLSDIQKRPLVDIRRWEENSQNVVQDLLVQGKTRHSDEIVNRVHDEFFGWGPLAPLLKDSSITEILVMGADQISIERNGMLSVVDDQFYSEITFQNFIHRICRSIRAHVTVERPFASGAFENFRVHVCDRTLAPQGVLISIRRHNLAHWTLAELTNSSWATRAQVQRLEELVAERKNILVVGPTSSGKTSALCALLGSISKDQRIGIIEDTQELKPPNAHSFQVLARTDTQGILSPITLSDLVREALRMRPDRLVLGEVRGAEAKDLLIALSTGHQGSFGTLHANSANEALIRLEMLIQMGAPQWSLTSIRRLIHLALHYIVVVGRTETGERRLTGLYRIASIEDFGVLTERVF